MSRPVAPSFTPLRLPQLPPTGADTDPVAFFRDTSPRILTVGIDKAFSTLAAAIAASRDGDVIKIDAGTYTDDTAIVKNRITIEGVGGLVRLVATQALANEKGILVVDNDLTVANVSFEGAFVTESAGANGAGIRYQGGNLHLINDVFTGNQDGIMGTPVDGLASNTITIDHCTFSRNGVGDPASQGYGYTHNAYIGAVDRLVVTNSVFEDVVGVGHELKSRAYINDIENNIIADGTSSASYSIDMPNGGQSLVQGNTITQGPNSQNTAIIHFGGEGFPYANTSLTVVGNAIVNDSASASAVGVCNQTVIAAVVQGNVIIGLTWQQIASGPVKATDNVDGQGHALPDSSSSQTLPANVLVFTDNAAHAVTMTASGTGVAGGGGLLTVTDPVGHVVVLGGSGGLVFTEQAQGGGSSIATKSGSLNRILLVGQDSVDSEGRDSIAIGSGNATVLVNDIASIAGGSGSNSYTVNGTATLTGGGGSDAVSVGRGGHLSVTGNEGYLSVVAVGGSFDVSATIAGVFAEASVAGGSVGVRSYGQALNFTTDGGLGQGAVIHCGAGDVSVLSHAADTIYAGSGYSNIQLSGGRQNVYAGTGQLAVYGMGIGVGNDATIHGNGGSIYLGGDTGNLTFIGGATAGTVDAALSNVTITGGSGHLTVEGGSRDRITGGSGGLTLTDMGANTITTARGSHNTLRLNGMDIVDSRGHDLIDAGAANQTITVRGNTRIVDASGSNVIVFRGRDFLRAIAGQDHVTVRRGASATVVSAATTSVWEAGAILHYKARAQPGAATVTVKGGAATVSSAPGSQLLVETTAGHHTRVHLGVGAATVDSNGADIIRAGSGADTIEIASDGSTVYGGTGSLVIDNLDTNAGHVVSVVGGKGDLRINGANGSALRFVGGTGSASIDAGAAGGTFTFGSGLASVTEAGIGAADVFQFNAGHGGGKDTITGFRVGVDELRFQGVGVATQTISGGATFLTLTDTTWVQLNGVTNLGGFG